MTTHRDDDAKASGRNPVSSHRVNDRCVFAAHVAPTRRTIESANKRVESEDVAITVIPRLLALGFYASSGTPRFRLALHT